ncbi:MAG TPA: lipid-binding SYLF domain-containing protein, partial [Vicinamibacterales bacterium]|nr:lipid-binding SYLF domain-containing protein [Vicinamibacterales bacterium]
MRTVLIASAVCLAVAGADATVNTSPKAVLAAAARVVRNVQATIPAAYWDKALCVAVFPESRSIEFHVGAMDGKGVMTCRTGDRWSAPAFIEIDKGKRISQVGADQLAVVLLVMNESAVQTLMRQHVTLGADVSVAPGPIGDQAHTDLNTRAVDVLAYTRAQGLYMNLAGGVLEPDEGA